MLDSGSRIVFLLQLNIEKSAGMPTLYKMTCAAKYRNYRPKEFYEQ